MRFEVGCYRLETLPNTAGELEEIWVSDTCLLFDTRDEAMQFIESRPAMNDWLYMLDYVGPTGGGLRIGYRHGHAWHHVDQTIPVETVN